MSVYRRTARFMMLAAASFAARALPGQTVTIGAGTLLDGKRGVQKNVRLTIQGSKIVRVDPGGSGPLSYDLGSLTVMPGWIDTHVHINGHFNRQGRAETR